MLAVSASHPAITSTALKHPRQLKPAKQLLKPRSTKTGYEFYVVLTLLALAKAEGHSIIRSQFIVSNLSLKAYLSLDGALGFFMIGVRFFVFLHRLPENRVDFFEMLDAFTEFSVFSHQHSVASLQLLKAQAQRFLLFASVRGMGRAMASLPLKLCDRRVKHLAVFEQIKRL